MQAEGVFQCLGRAHLVGDRADAADAGDGIDHLVIAAALEELLEIARRFEDIQRQFLDPAALDPQTQRTLALDAGHRRDVDRDRRSVIAEPRAVVPLSGLAEMPVRGC